MNASEAIAAAAAVPGVVLIWAGVLKLTSPGPASVSLMRFGLVQRVRPAYGRGAGLVEVLAGVLLVIRPLSVYSYPVPAVLLAFFGVLLTRAVARGATFSCACFGASEEAIGLTDVVRTILLFCLTAAAAVAVWRTSPGSLHPGRQFEVASLSASALSALALAFAISQTQPFGD